MQNVVRFAFLMLVVSICLYFTTQTRAIAQDLPYVTLGFTMINGKIGGTSEATEGDLLLFSVQSNQTAVSPLDVTVNIAQTGNFIGTDFAYAPLANQFTHGVVGKNTVTIAAGKKIAFIGVSLQDDFIHESDGSVTVALGKESSYLIRLTPVSERRKSIQVSDNELEPAFSLETQYTSVSDSDFFEVSVVSDQKSNEEFAIDLSIFSPLMGLISSESQTATLNFAARETRKTHLIRIEPNIAIDATNGHPVAVSIDTSDSYRINNFKQSVRVNVVPSANLPVLAISSTNSVISEGQAATFAIGIENALTTATIVNLGISTTGDNLTFLTSDTIEIPANVTSVNYIVPTHSDGSLNTGANGSITVTLEPGSGYKLPSQKTESIMVTNDGSDQMPIIYINNKVGNSGLIDSIMVGTSGVNAEFTVYSNVDPGPDFELSYLPTNLVGSFLGGNANRMQTETLNFSPVTGISNLFSADLPIPVMSDVISKSGEIKITLLNPSTSTYSVFSSKNSATMLIMDQSNSLPVVSISGGGTFEEGESGIFYLQADRQPSSPISVRVSLSQSGGSFLASTSTRTVRISDTEPVALLLTTRSDGTVEDEGAVTATLLADTSNPAKYELGANIMDSITVFDNDVANVPVISISRTSSSIQEGQTAEFTLNTNPVPLQNLVVDIDVLVEGDYFAAGVGPGIYAQTVTISSEGRGKFNLPTLADTEAEPDGNITVSVRASRTDATSYSVGAQAKTSVTINDDDHAGVPTISVVASDDIVEGDYAVFTIRADRRVTSNFNVRLSVNRVGNFFARIGMTTQTIPFTVNRVESGVSSQTSFYIFQEPTRFDYEDEEDGSISITILADTSQNPKYSVGVISTATVKVTDDDVAGPVISIRSTYSATGVTINNPFTFTVHSIFPVEQDTTISLAVQKIGSHTPNFTDMDLLQNNQRVVTISANEARESSMVNIENCATCPENFTSGRYVLTLMDGADYSVHSTQNKVEINIKNNDPNSATLPVITIAPTNSQPVIAGGIASYTLTSDKPITEAMEINYWTLYEHTFFSDVTSGGLVKFTFNADTTAPYTQILAIQTSAYEENFEPFNLPVIILEGRDYVIGANAVASVKIINNFSISIKSLTEQVVEGGAVLFAFTTDKPVPAPIIANISVTDPGNYLTTASRNRTQIILNARGDTSIRDFYLSLTTEIDGVMTAPNTIKVEILPGEGYLIGKDSVAEVPVRDGNIKISVVPLSAEVTKGSLAHFRIIANAENLSSTPHSVDVKLGIVGKPNSTHAVTNQTETMTLRNGRNVKDISIMVNADTNADYEFAGALIVFVKNPDGRTVESFSLPKKIVYQSDYYAIMKVIDDDVPNGISILPLTTSIIEGEVAEFQILADSATGSDRTFNLIGSRNVPSTIKLPATHQSVVLRVPTGNNKAQHQPPGEIVVSIDTGSGYTPAATNTTARVVILDTIKPEFKLLNNPMYIHENQEFDIIVLAEPVPKVNYTVTVSDSSGDSQRVMFNSRNYTFLADEDTLVISGTAPDVAKDSLNVLTILVEPTDLTKGRGRALFKLPIHIITSDPDPTLSKPKVSVTSLNSTDMNGNPTVTKGRVAQFEIAIKYGDTTSIENNQIVNKKAEPQPVLVTFQLAGTNFGSPPSADDYLDNQGQLNTGEFEAAVNAYRMRHPSLYECDSDFSNRIFSCWVNESRRFDIPTIVGSTASSIKMKILGGRGQLLADYRVEQSKASATVALVNATLPQITVFACDPGERDACSTGPTANDQVIREAKWVRIYLHSDRNIPSPITVWFALDDPGGYLRDSLNNLEMYRDPKSSSRQGLYPVRLSGWSTDFQVWMPRTRNRNRADNRVTITVIQPGDTTQTKYEVGPRTNSDPTARRSVTSFLVWDDDTPRGGLSIIPQLNSIQSGDMAVFNVKTANTTKFTADTTISVLLDQGEGDIIAGDQKLQREVIIRKNHWNEFLRIRTKELSDYSGVQMLTATLQEGENYTLVPDLQQRSASITVHAYHQYLIASVVNATKAEGTEYVNNRAVRTSIVEGEAAVFDFTLSLPSRITSYREPEEGVVVSFTVTETGGNFIYMDDTIDYNGIQTIKLRGLGTTSLAIQTQVATGVNTGGRITLNIINDPASPDFYRPGRARSVSIAITDNGMAAPELSISKGMNPVTNQPIDSITEGGVLRSVITINPAAPYPFNIQLQATETGNFLNVGSDGKNTYIKVPVNSTEAYFTPTVFDDDVNEDDGIVTFTIGEREGYTIESGSESVSIQVLDNDAPPIISIESSVAVQEGSTTIGEVVMLSKPSNKVVEFTFITLNGSATSPIDFTGYNINAPEMGQFAVGSTTTSIPIEILEDLMIEEDENFKVRIISVANANFDQNATFLETTISIIDSGKEVISVSIDDSSTTEGNTGNKALNFAVSLSTAASSPVSVKWSTFILDLDDKAIPGEDFIESTENTLEFEPGNTTKNISVTIIGDTETEPTETFTVFLSEPSTGVEIAINYATGQIVNDDVQLGDIDLSISAKPKMLMEGSPAIFSITSMQGIPTDGLRVQLNVTQIGLFIAWRAPQSLIMRTSPAELRINTIDDHISESNGSITVTLIEEPNSYRVFGKGYATVQISSDDPENLAEPERISIASHVATTLLTTISNSPIPSSAEFVIGSERPLVSITAIDTQIDEGGSANFLIVSKNGRESNNISVSLKIHNESVYIEGPTTLNVQLTGQDSKSISISTLDNEHAGENGLVSVAILESPSYLISEYERSVTVTVSDIYDRNALHQKIELANLEVLPVQLRSIGANLMEVVSNRVELISSNLNSSTIQLNGRNSISDMLTNTGNMVNQESFNKTDLLVGSKFNYELVSNDKFLGSMSIWGMSESKQLNPSNTSSFDDWDCESLFGQVGFDTRLQNGLIGGMATTLKQTQIDFDHTIYNNLNYKTNMTGVLPYFGWTSQDKADSLQLYAEFGQGEIAVNQGEQQYDTFDTNYSVYGVSGIKNLYSSTSNSLLGESKLNFVSEVWHASQLVESGNKFVEDSELAVGTFRTAVEGTHQIQIESIAVNPQMAIGFRGDSYDQQFNVGMESIGKIDLQTSSLTAATIGQALIPTQTEDHATNKWLVTTQLEYDSNKNDLGLLLDFSYSWGDALEDQQGEFWLGNLTRFGAIEHTNYSGIGFSTEIGFGFKVFDDSGVVTPFASIQQNENSINTIRVGSRLIASSNINMDLVGTRKVINPNDIEQRIDLKSNIKW